MVVANSLLRVFLTVSTTPWRKECFNYHRTFACFVFIIYALKTIQYSNRIVNCSVSTLLHPIFQIIFCHRGKERFSKRDNRCLERNYEETARKPDRSCHATWLYQDATCLLCSLRGPRSWTRRSLTHHARVSGRRASRRHSNKRRTCEQRGQMRGGEAARETRQKWVAYYSPLLLAWLHYKF